MKRFYMFFSFIFFMFPIVFSFLAALKIIIIQDKSDMTGILVVAWAGGLIIGGIFAELASDIEKEELSKEKKQRTTLKDIEIKRG